MVAYTRTGFGVVRFVAYTHTGLTDVMVGLASCTCYATGKAFVAAIHPSTSLPRHNTFMVRSWRFFRLPWPSPKFRNVGFVAYTHTTLVAIVVGLAAYTRTGLTAVVVDLAAYMHTGLAVVMFDLAAYTRYATHVPLRQALCNGDPSLSLPRHKSFPTRPWRFFSWP